MKSNCPFCRDDVHEVSFLESPNFLVIYNQAPILPGHSLVIPKNHFSSLLDLPLAHTHELVNLSVHSVRLLIKIFNAEGFDWTIQDGKVAGQTIDHLHLHLIPRYKDDLPDPGDWYFELDKNNRAKIDNDKRKKHSNEQLVSIANDLKTRIKNMSD